jgi:hypothetical protein
MNREGSARRKIEPLIIVHGGKMGVFVGLVEIMYKKFTVIFMDEFLKSPFVMSNVLSMNLVSFSCCLKQKQTRGNCLNNLFRYQAKVSKYRLTTLDLVTFS